MSLSFAGFGKKVGEADYHADIDPDRDGEITVDDYFALLGQIPADISAMTPAGPGKLSRNTAVGPDNTLGFAGYQFCHATGLYAVRFRHYDPETGRWLQRDPAGYVDGLNLYQYVVSDPVRYVDWNSLAAHEPGNDDLNGNLTVNPPFIANPTTSTCSVEFRCNYVIGGKRHCYLVITNPDGSLTEVRAGPLNSGSGSDSSNKQTADDPCGCGGGGQDGWGPVVPYIGPHGPTARPDGTSSPDGTKPVTFRAPVSSGAMSDCEFANCLMRMMRDVIGQSCKNYVLGIKWSRNSNTAISTILAICGSPDPKPANVDAPGWGERWFR